MNNKKTIFAIVFLIGAYVLCQAIADIGATKILQVGSITFPAGTFIFAATFTLRDLVHKRLGKEWAKAAIYAAALFNIVQSGYLLLMTKIPAAPFYQLGSAWDGIFAVVPAIAIGSILAELVSELIDTEIYHFWMTKLSHLPQWSRVLASNVVSLPIDTLIFSMLAFVFLPPVFGGEPMPITVALGIGAGQIIWKAIITIITMPTIYLIKEKSLISNEFNV